VCLLTLVRASLHDPVGRLVHVPVAAAGPWPVHGKRSRAARPRGRRAYQAVQGGPAPLPSQSSAARQHARASSAVPWRRPCPPPRSPAARAAPPRRASLSARCTATPRPWIWITEMLWVSESCSSPGDPQPLLHGSAVGRLVLRPPPPLARAVPPRGRTPATPRNVPLAMTPAEISPFRRRRTAAQPRSVAHGPSLRAPRPGASLLREPIARLLPLRSRAASGPHSALTRNNSLSRRTTTRAPRARHDR